MADLTTAVTYNLKGKSCRYTVMLGKGANYAIGTDKKSKQSTWVFQIPTVTAEQAAQNRATNPNLHDGYLENDDIMLTSSGIFSGIDTIAFLQAFKKGDYQFERQEENLKIWYNGKLDSIIVREQFNPDHAIERMQFDGGQIVDLQALFTHPPFASNPYWSASLSESNGAFQLQHHDLI